MRQEARARIASATSRVHVPDYMEQVIATFSQLARSSSQVNQRSGVSGATVGQQRRGARCQRAAPWAACRRARRRAAHLRPRRARRVNIGKIEIESLEEGREGAILENLVKAAVLTVYKERVTPDQVRDVIAAFDEGIVAHTGEDIASADEVASARSGAGVAGAGAGARPAATSHRQRVAAAVEFVLEGLHLSKRLNKDSSGSSATYRGRS